MTATHLEIFKCFILALALPGDEQGKELQAKHIEVSAGLLHASAGMRFLLELLGTVIILASSTSSLFSRQNTIASPPKQRSCVDLIKRGAPSGGQCSTWELVNCLDCRRAFAGSDTFSESNSKSLSGHGLGQKWLPLVRHCCVLQDKEGHGGRCRTGEQT